MDFADLWWWRDRLGFVLIEMKSRKEKKLLNILKQILNQNGIKTAER